MKKIIYIIIFIVIFGSSILLYSRFIATRGLKIKEYKITNNKITDTYHGLKIVHLSDIHYNSIIHKKELDNIVNKINYINPDIVVITGDLFDSRINLNTNEVINSLKNINAKLGKYAISGNHDLPIEDFNYIIKESGFTNLNNTYKLIYNKSNEPIIISGISSNLVDKDINLKTKEFDEYLGNLKTDDIKPIYSILLMHEPDYVDKLNLEKYDLVLAGHSHNGQVNIPYLKNLVLPEGGKKYYENYYKIKNTDLYVSSGLGTSKYKIRLFNKPSFNFYRITKK